jgi:hypothetical protein
VLTKARALGVVILLLAASQAGTHSPAPVRVTTPEDEFGARIGADYFLATYGQLETYWKKLDRQSDRLALVDIGRTEEGRTQWMAIVSAPDNIERLSHYRNISRRLAHGEALSDAHARALAHEGRAVVWIDGGLHANEVLGAQQLIETVYQLVSRNDSETLRILHDVIVLVVDANPDGHDLAANWYMREKNPLARTLNDVPAPYQKYVGHDNNRDFYMGTQTETRNINRVLYRDWLPQIVYDHHQAELPDGIMFAPPFREPSNYFLDPLITASLTRIGTAMRARFAADGLAGITDVSGADYSTWWNGGLRTTPYFHNQIGLLTETIGNPTPIERSSLLGGTQHWHFRQSIDYSVAANYAVLDIASRDRETWLFNSYLMARRSIDRGNRDSWTATPHRSVARTADPRARDPRGYILSADQPDFLTATKFVNALLQAGVIVHRATSVFSANDRTYPRGSFVVKTAQPFRAHVLDMFEPQDHPDDIPYPGARPRDPYDMAGWTLAFQMGVKFDRILDAFSGPFEQITTNDVKPVPGQLAGPDKPAGYFVSHHQNDAVIAVNRLLKAGESVFWLRDRVYIAATPSARRILEEAAAGIGISVRATQEAPHGTLMRLRPVRIGLADRRGGWSSSGWIRWLLERYEFPFELLYPEAFDAGRLARFDVVILPSEASVNNPLELKRFVEPGGMLLAIGDATSVFRSFGIPISSPAVKSFIPGSVVRASVDNATPIGYGFEEQVDMFFDNSPVFRLDPAAASRGVRAVAWFATPAPLRSGWAVGQEHLENTVAVVDAPVGKGRVVLFGPEIAFRAQSHGTFRFLFNGIYSGSAIPARLSH